MRLARVSNFLVWETGAFVQASTSLFCDENLWRVNKGKKGTEAERRLQRLGKEAARCISVRESCPHEKIEKSKIDKRNIAINYYHRDGVRRI